MKEDKRILLKFCRGNKVEEHEYDIVKRYSKTGIIKFGFSFKKKEIQAELTEAGKKLLGCDVCDTKENVDATTSYRILIRPERWRDRRQKPLYPEFLP